MDEPYDRVGSPSRTTCHSNTRHTYTEGCLGGVRRLHPRSDIVLRENTNKKCSRIHSQTLAKIHGITRTSVFNLPGQNRFEIGQRCTPLRKDTLPLGIYKYINKAEDAKEVSKISPGSVGGGLRDFVRAIIVAHTSGFSFLDRYRDLVVNEGHHLRRFVWIKG